MPDPNFLHSLLPETAGQGSSNRCSYVLGDVDHALRHASCLLNILHGAAGPEKSHGQLISSSTKHIPWLVDSLQALNEQGKRWKEIRGFNSVAHLRQALDLTGLFSGVEQTVSHKLYAMIVLLSADVAERLDELISQDEEGKEATMVLATALVQLADISIKRRPISKLVAAHLLKPLDRVFIEGHLSDSSGDLKVRTSLMVIVQTRPDSPSSVLYLFFAKL